MIYQKTPTEIAIYAAEREFKKVLRKVLRTHYKAVLAAFVNTDPSITRLVVQQIGDCGRIRTEILHFEGRTEVEDLEEKDFTRAMPFLVAFHEPRGIPYCFRVDMDLVKKTVQIDFRER